eukprot:TRINITY_DN2377_c0_g1_i1.p2 TRINITY_DN2377_c0_g1~~TRINITY_DN2377_c0_g1_i1.p2  ORF type:complete len:116 (+),score=27.73 TRINITY_DN2377_c0_g1_i1:32-379(+)
MAAADLQRFVKIETIEAGDGVNFPKAGQTVTCHYTLTLENGREIDSSRGRGRPFQFQIGKKKVIRGWDEGLLTFSKGQRAKLTIQPEWGYGAAGAGGVVPPNAVLIFDVQLISFE